MSEVYTLQSTDALARWDEIAQLLKRVERMDTPISEVREMVSRCEAQIWCVGDPIECVLVTKIQNTLDCRYGLMWLGAGDLRMIPALHTIVQNWFREMECKYVQIIGRRGWKKFLPDYEEQDIILVKKL